MKTDLEAISYRRSLMGTAMRYFMPPMGRRGAGMFEYGALAGLIAVVSILSVETVGSKVETVFCRAETRIDAPNGDGEDPCFGSGVDLAEGADDGNGLDDDIMEQDDGDVIAMPPPGGDVDPGDDGEEPAEGVFDDEQESPVEFDFTDVQGVFFEEEVTSDLVTLSGLTGEVPVEVLRDGFVSINGGPFVKSGTASNGDTIRLRGVSSDEALDARSFFVNVGGFRAGWLVETYAGDLSPDSFHFPPVTGAYPDRTYYTAPFRLSGVTGSINAGTSNNSIRWQFQKSNGVWANLSGSRDIENGTMLRLSGEPSEIFGGVETSDLTLGTGTGTWSITTEDTFYTPNFGFPDFPDMPTGGEVYSNIVTLGDFSGRTPLEIHDRNGAEILVNGARVSGADPVWLSAGDEIQMVADLGSKPTWGATDSARISIGNSGIDEWFVEYTDGLKPVTPSVAIPAYVSGNSGDVIEHTFTVGGFSGPAILGTSDGSAVTGVRLNGSSDVGNGKSIVPGDTVTLVVSIGSRDRTASITLGDTTYEIQVDNLD